MGKLEQNPWQGWEVPDLGLGERLGHGVVDLPLDRRSAWRPAMGNSDRTPRRCLSHLAAGRIENPAR